MLMVVLLLYLKLVLYRFHLNAIKLCIHAGSVSAVEPREGIKPRGRRKGKGDKSADSGEDSDVSGDTEGPEHEDNSEDEEVSLRRLSGIGELAV